MTTENQILVGHTRGSEVSDVLERTESKLLDLEIDQVLDLKIFLGHAVPPARWYNFDNLLRNDF